VILTVPRLDHRAIPSPRLRPYSGSPAPARVCRRPSEASPCRGGRFRVRLR